MVMDEMIWQLGWFQGSMAYEFGGEKWVEVL
jgi:hypothetical protein